MDIPTSVNDVMQKANDGASTAMSEEISNLLNSEWVKLQKALDGEDIPPVVAISFSPNHDAFIAILEKYIKFDDSEDPAGILAQMNMVASVYNTVNPETGEEECAIDMDYYYGDEEFAPALYNGRELADGEVVKHFDHIPTTIDIIKMCVELGTGTPLFDIDKCAPFYGDIAQFLPTDDEDGDDSAGMEDCTNSMPPKIAIKSHPIEMPDNSEDETEADEECAECDPKTKCPACERQKSCAFPCYDPDADTEDGTKDDEVPMENG